MLRRSLSVLMLALAAALLALGGTSGCKKKEAKAPTEAPAAPAGDQAAAEGNALADLEPTAEEKKTFEDQAKAEITKDNAKAIAEQLAKEIDSDPDK